jgi:hypothetical protein
MSAQVGQQPPMTAVQKLAAVNEQTWLSMGKFPNLWYFPLLGNLITVFW